MKKSVKIISLILIVSICLPLINAGATQSTEQSEDFFEKYKSQSAYLEAVYPGDYNAAQYKDIGQDLYSLNINYSRVYKSFVFGYIHTIDEAKKIYGETNEKVLAAVEKGLNYYTPGWDNSLRYEKDVTDINGVKKDCWFSTSNWRGDVSRKVSGGMTFGIKDGSKITGNDSDIVIAIEYLDKGNDAIRVSYVNDKWQSGKWSGSMRIIPRANTNEWRVAYISVNDAKFMHERDSGNTALCSGKEDILLQGDELYISRIMVVPTKGDYNIVKDYDVLPCPKVTYQDKVTGRTWHVAKIPGYRTYRNYVTGQSWNKYGTKFLVHVADGMLYEYDTVNETIRFIDYGYTSQSYVSPNNDIFYISNGYACKMNWDTYEKTVLCKVPDNTTLTTMSATIDGKYFSGYLQIDGVTTGRIVRLNTEKGSYDYNETKDFTYNPDTMGVGHPIINPTYGNLIFFCHEGTTTLIPDRLWMVDVDSGKMKNIFLQSYNDNGTTAECSGHEVWSRFGDYLYFVKYSQNQNKGQNGIVRIPFKDGKFTGEREYINGDAPYWHCYPSGDNNWVVADDASGKIWIMSTQTHKSYQISDFNIIGRRDPHPHFSYDSRMVNWDYCIDGIDENLGVAWADVSDITMAKTHETTTFELGKQGKVVSHSNTISESSNVIKENKSYAKAENNNRIYYDINDDYLKSVHQQMKVKVTTYSDKDDVMTLGYTSAVHDDTNWHRYEDTSIKFDIKQGVNTYTLDLGFVNANNICKYASDMYFVAQSGTTYVADIDIMPYQDSFDTYTDNSIYDVAASYTDYSKGMSMLSSYLGLAYKDRLVDVNDEAGIEAEGIADSVVEYAKQNGIGYVTHSTDGAWMHKAVADSDGVIKNSWFTTKNVCMYGTVGPRSTTGQMYLRVTNDTIGAQDSDLVFTFEYLDNRTTPFYVRYVTGSGTNTYKITPTNTGKWKTVSFAVSDASMSSVNKGTGLATGSEDFRFEANGEDLYVSKIMIAKQGDKTIEDVSVSKDGKVTASVVNNTKSAMSSKLYTAVYNVDGTLDKVYAGDSVNVAKASKQTMSQNVDLSEGQYAKVFVFSDKLNPYRKGYCDVSVSYQNNKTIVEWNNIVNENVVYYKVFRDGIFEAITTDTKYEISDTKACNWRVEATDFYGKPIK